MDEIVRAIKGLKVGKTPSGGRHFSKSMEIWGAHLSKRMLRTISKICDDGHVPQAWKYASIVIIYKNNRML